MLEKLFVLKQFVQVGLGLTTLLRNKTSLLVLAVEFGI